MESKHPPVVEDSKFDKILKNTKLLARKKELVEVWVMSKERILGEFLFLLTRFQIPKWAPSVEANLGFPLGAQFLYVVCNSGNAIMYYVVM